MTAVLRAEQLEAEGHKGRIFGPLDLELHEGEVCLVTGEQGSGKSALLLALVGRLREASGGLWIDGIDVSEDARSAMERTALARIGDYVVPEDRLTFRESIYERCYLDGISVREGARRVDEFERCLGIRFDRAIEMSQFTPLERTVAAVMLAMLRPAKVVVLDDADTDIPHAQLGLLFELLGRLVAVDKAVLVATTVNTQAGPSGCVELTLPRPHPATTSSLAEELVGQRRLEGPDYELDRDVLFDAIRHAAPVVDETDGDSTDQPTHDVDDTDEEEGL